MSTIPEIAYHKARRHGLDLSVERRDVPVDVFAFRALEPKPEMLRAFEEARRRGRPWVDGMPVPVLTYHPGSREFRIMDGMLRICSAQRAGFDRFPALVASGETYDELEDVLRDGYYGEDFIEMLAMAEPQVRENLELRRRRFLSGR